jgi:phosphatidylserine/phosphatidylglycerophosphate/cardiolipin synthase-like enzyme
MLFGMLMLIKSIMEEIMFHRRRVGILSGIAALAAIAIIMAFGKDVQLPKAGMVTDALSALTMNAITGTNTAKVEYYFPRAGQDVQSQLISVINSSDETLDVAIYSLTDTKIGDAIIQAHQRGVAVRVITDQEQAAGKYQKSLLKKLVQAGVQVKENTHSGLMHLKVTIVDNKIATTGSFNYTKAAENTNDEVFVILRDETAAKDFEAEFETMWNDEKRFTDFK